MYLWRVSIAITLGSVWYFSESGGAVTQYFLGFLFCVCVPLLCASSGRESSSTQTEEEAREDPLQVRAACQACAAEMLFLKRENYQVAFACFSQVIRI